MVNMQNLYIRDAQGNCMAIYEYKVENDGGGDDKNLYLRACAERSRSKRNIYGSSRVGLENVNEIIASSDGTNVNIATEINRKVGDKQFELSNHLGNVLEVISDHKITEHTAGTVDYYAPEIIAQNDYYPFGMLLPNRHEDGNEYRYGFNGMEKDDEVYGSEGASVNYTYRMHNARVGRFFTVDPLEATYPHNAPYNFSENVLIHAVELEGLELRLVFNSSTLSEDARAAIEVYYENGDYQELVSTMKEIMSTPWSDPENNIGWAEENLEEGGEDLEYQNGNADATPVAFYNFEDETGIDLFLITESEDGGWARENIYIGNPDYEDPAADRPEVEAVEEEKGFGTLIYDYFIAPGSLEGEEGLKKIGKLLQKVVEGTVEYIQPVTFPIIVVDPELIIPSPGGVVNEGYDYQ